MTRHELKTWPAYFAAVRSGQKRFEIRRNDREFKVGDILVLKEFDPSLDAYTGQIEERQITFVLSEEDFGVIHGFVAIGFGPAPHPGASPADARLTPQALAAWHEAQATKAELRAGEARKTAAGYGPGVAGDRWAAVAEAGEAEARFHAAAARLLG